MQNVRRPNSRTNGVDTVNWQDEQRKLQEQYERGEISAQEFRTRRQQLLAAGAGSQQQPHPQAPDATQAMRPAGQQQAQQPAEPTQAVTQHPGADPDRTQVVAGGGWQQQPPGQQPGMPGQQNYGQSDYAQQQGEEPPPWQGSEFPPLVAPGSPDWPGHGSEAFQQQKGNKGKIIALVVVVLVLAGLGVGGYFLFAGGDSTPSADRGGGGNRGGGGPVASSSSQAAPTTTQAPKLFPIGDMPVKPTIRKDVTSFAQFDDINYFTDAELQAYQDAGAGKAKLAVFKVGDKLVTLTFTKADNPQAAYTAAKTLNEIQVHNGRTVNPDEPAGVRVSEIKANADAKQPAGIRAHYSHGKVIVRVDVKGSSLDGITPTFNTVLAAELKVLAPDA